MAGKWSGNPGNKIDIGFFYDAIEMNATGTQARITGGRIRLRQGVNISDQTNSLSWSGDLVADGTQNNIKLSGSGDKTIKTVTGSWVTLSTTEAVTATASISFSGVNYAAKTLKVSVTVKFPLAGDGGTVSPPGVGGDAYPNPWADDNAPDWATEPYVETIYAVRLPAAPAEYRVVPAWDISIDLDGGRAPYGTARFKAPVEYLSEAAYTLTNPRAVPVVQIDAGWRYPGSGTNLHTLFSGVITERRLRVDDSGAYCEFTAESYESILEYPSHVVRAVNNAWTTLTEFYSGSTFYRRPATVEHPANLAPDAAALAEYRAMQLEIDDDLGDFTRACASALGQWTRGSMTATTPTLETITDPYPYQRLITLDIDAFSQLERLENLDNWGNILRLTTQWTNGSGDTVNKRKVYPASTATSGTGAVRARDITLNLKPPSGATPPTGWAPAKRWLRRINEASRGSWSGQCRALWWIQPRIDGVLLTGSPLTDTGGQVQRVQYLVDQGLMQLTWNVVHP